MTLGAYQLVTGFDRPGLFALVRSGLRLFTARKNPEAHKCQRRPVARRSNGQPTDGKGTRPSVSEMVVELLTKHRAELDAME